jgi:DUF2075 family protein
MFIIKDVDFPSNNYGLESYLSNWPMLYILENGKKAYVGQTNSIVKRMGQHSESKAKQEFTKAHFIYSDRFNQSATFDYESRLISLMSADRQFVLTNLNAGITGVEYFDKASYDADFIELWKDLQQRNLAKSTIEELEQSDIFKYSPYKTLTTEQRHIVSEIVDNLRRSLDRRIVVGGMPGSGKTILAIYLFKLLRESREFAGLKIGMVVPPSSLKATVKEVFKSINKLSAKDVIGPTDVSREEYDILIVDEAHRLKMCKNLSSYKVYYDACDRLGLPHSATQLDWIMKQSKCSILFFDHDQIVFPMGIDVGKAIQNNSFDTRMMSYYTLLNQMRCKGGMTYLEDIKSLVHGTIDHKVCTDNYEIRIAENFNTFDKLYKAREEEYGLTRMVAGYAWEWKSKKDKSAIDIEIEGCGKRWNSVLENWVHSDNAVNEVGCIHSTQGYDLNYGFVIVGKDIRYDPNSKRVFVDRNNYYDRYGQQGATDEELDDYIKNIYYVLMSRGIKGTYLYVCDDNLREYFKQYIDTVSEKDI